MDKIEKKHLEHLQNLQAAEAAMKWYGWGSPIGISIFFLTIVVIVAVVKILFFGW